MIESVPFRTLGADTDDTALCESGTTTRDHLESPEGVAITLEESGALHNAAKADGGVMDLYTVQEFFCDDGSGVFVLKTHTRSDYAKPVNEQDTSTWEVESGTGDYTDLSGSGEVPMYLGGGSPNEMDEVVTTYVGDVQTG